jgi:hypothetical protein
VSYHCRAPIVPRDHSLSGAKRVKESHRVTDEMQQGVLVDRLPVGRTDRHRACRERWRGIRRGQRCELVAPRIPALRKAAAQDDQRPLPLLSNVKVDAVRLDRDAPQANRSKRECRSVCPVLRAAAALPQRAVDANSACFLPVRLGQAAAFQGCNYFSASPLGRYRSGPGRTFMADTERCRSDLVAISAISFFTMERPKVL